MPAPVVPVTMLGMNWRRLGARFLLAVLLGNAIYFRFLYPYLPEWAQHTPFRADPGILLDFLICVAIFILSGGIWKKSSPRSK